MNNEDLLEAIGQTDEKLLEQSERRKTKPVRTLAAIAAVICVCMLLSEVVGLLMPTPIAQPNGHEISAEKITWNMEQKVLLQSSSSITGAMLETQGPAYQFAYNMSIEAEVIRVLPDTYAMPGVSTGSQRYRVLHLKVKDTILGKNFPKEIYYLLPNTMDPDLTEYDSLILNLQQRGVENYLLINVEQSRAETFDYVFGRINDYAADFGGMLAFKNGILDTSLWNKEGWGEKRDYMLWMTESSKVYPGRIGRSVEETKQAIRTLAEEFKSYREKYYATEVITANKFAGLDSGALFAYLEPFENGTFAQVLYAQSEYLHFFRIINGFSTNEYIDFSVKDQIAARWGAEFTQEDMENLPDLVWVMEHLQEVLPDEYTTEEAMQRFCGVKGEYYKLDDEIYGVVTVEWGDPNYEYPKGVTCLITAKVSEQTYILVYQSGTHRIVTDEELKEMIPGR